MDDSRSVPASSLNNGGIVSQQRVDERAFGMSRCGMHDHAGGLVDAQEVLVFVDDVQRNGFGLNGLVGLPRWQCDGDGLPWSHLVRGLLRLPVDRHSSSFDQPLAFGATQLRDPIAHDYV